MLFTPVEDSISEVDPMKARTQSNEDANDVESEETGGNGNKSLNSLYE